MSVPSTIGLLQADGSIKAIYVRTGGYPVEQVITLRLSYRTTEDVEKLLALGDLLQIGEELGSQQDIDNPIPNTCVAFARDGGEELISAIILNNLEEWLMDFNNCDYAYLFDGQKWEFYEHICTTRFLKPGIEILSYWNDAHESRVTPIYDYLDDVKKLGLLGNLPTNSKS